MGWLYWFIAGSFCGCCVLALILLGPLRMQAKSSREEDHDRYFNFKAFL